jgi:hypothetical protein
MAVSWSKVGQMLAQIAPALAGTLATPAAGVAVSALCAVLGLDSAQVTPDALSAAVVGATPDQLQAIRQADQKHQEVVMQSGLDALSNLTNAEQADMANTRNLAAQEIAHGTPWTVAASAAVRPLWGLGSFALVAGSLLFGYQIPASILPLIQSTMDFFFGSRLVEKIMPHIAEVMASRKDS